MQIRSNIYLVNGSYEVQISMEQGPAAISGRENDALNQFGHMPVEFGGTFELGEGSFSLPENLLSVPGQLPMKRVFSIRDYEDDATANDTAVRFRDVILERIGEAVTTLLSRSAGVTGSRVTNVPADES